MTLPDNTGDRLTNTNVR